MRRSTRAHAVQLPRSRRERLKRRAELPARWTLPRLLALPTFALLWLVVALSWPVHPGVAALYIGLSTLTFHLYAVDKLAAKQGRRRTPEKTLHLLSLAGGWPGALLAQPRHAQEESFWVLIQSRVSATPSRQEICGVQPSLRSAFVISAMKQS